MHASTIQAVDMQRPGIALSVTVICALVCAECAAVHSQGHVQGQIVSNAELVKVPVIVFDQKGSVATDLTKNDFRIFEDGAEQQIISLDAERVPVSFVVLADLSSSMTRKIPFVQDATLSLIDEQPEKHKADEYSVVGVAARSRLLVPFTDDQEDLEQRLSLFLTPTKENTALFDGVWLGVSTADEEAANKNRAMIVITDGGDNHSRYSLRETKRMLEEADVPVFAIMAKSSFLFPGFSSPSEGNPLPRKKGPMGAIPSFPSGIGVSDGDYIGPAERRGPENMKTLAEASGGGVFTAKREEDLPRIVRTLGLALRYRYFLTYTPDRLFGARRNQSATTDRPQQHKIRIELSPKDKFPGYSVPYYKNSYTSAN